MNRDSARALVWVSGVLVVLGPIPTAHAAMFFLPLLAAVAAVFPTVLGRGRTRIAAGILLAISLLCVVARAPGYVSELERFSSRAAEAASDS